MTMPTKQSCPNCGRSTTDLGGGLCDDEDCALSVNEAEANRAKAEALFDAEADKAAKAMRERIARRLKTVPPISLYREPK